MGLGRAWKGDKPSRLFWRNDALDAPRKRGRREDYEKAEERDINGDLRMVGEGEANLVSSMTDISGKHLPVIDIDFPCSLVASTTEGHFHLYIEKLVDAEKYFAMLDAMADAGVVEKGYAGASRSRGMTLVRKPGVKKVNV